MAFTNKAHFALSAEDAREAYSAEDIQAEQAEIQAAFQSMVFGEKLRQTTLACFKKCGGNVKYPFRIEPAALMGKQEICFGDCLNINFEKGPYLTTLGEVPEESIPKKFIWSHTL